jgi:hypothetical protein
MRTEWELLPEREEFAMKMPTKYLLFGGTSGRAEATTIDEAKFHV